MTPDELWRKGSFLHRHYANLRGPLTDVNGQPTRLTLQAHAWGEPVPKTEAAAQRLAAKGTQLLEKYHAAKSDGTKKAAKSKKAKLTGFHG